MIAPARVICLNPTSVSRFLCAGFGVDIRHTISTFSNPATMEATVEPIIVALVGSVETFTAQMPATMPPPRTQVTPIGLPRQPTTLTPTRFTVYAERLTG